MELRYLLVLICFFVSGFAGLLYETTWTREFSFVFGTSNLAVATVLAAYMGGLSLGAAVAARHMHRIRRPVLVYGLLELGIAASALAVPSLIRAVTLLYRPLFSTAEILPEEGGMVSALFYGAASFLILAVPTTLMGATLPMLARHAVQEERQIGRRVGTLYAVNTAGAIAGTLVTAFLLFPELGLRRTVWVGAAMNALVFVAAALIARGAAVLGPEQAPARRRNTEVRGAIVLVVAFASSVASFTYENLWFRLFEHVLGASIYAFSTMLAGFLIGIAFGGGLAAPLARTQRGSAYGLAISQLGVALFSFLAFAFVDHLPELALNVYEPGPLGLLRRASVAAGLILPSTLCIGASFPFAVRALTEAAEAAASTSARVYAWNTLGAIVGSVSAGFLVIPALGFERSLVAMVLLNLLCAALAAGATRPLLRPVLAAAGACALALLAVRPTTPWKVISASAFSLDVPSLTQSSPFDPESVVYLGVGRSSTVLLFEEGGGWRLRNSGLPEALIEAPGAVPRNSLTPHWLAMLPAFAPAAPRELLVIGLGGGVVVEEVPDGFERIDVIELEREVLEANRCVAGRRNKDPLADPRVRVWLNDARGALTLTGRRYGAIVSQPSHPWTAGASHLYTRDFFEQVRGRLAAGGVFVQWMGLGFVDESLLRSLIATLLDVFPHVRVYQPEPGALLFVASSEPLELESQVEGVVARDPETFARSGVRVREDLAAALRLDEAGARKLAEGARLITDDDNRFATDSSRVLALQSKGIAALLDLHDPLAGGLDGFDSIYVIRRLVQMQKIPRAERIAKSLGSSLERTLGELEVALGRGQRGKAHALSSRALAIEPRSAGARFGALLASGTPAGGEVPELLARAQRLRAARDWNALALLDGALASVDLRDPAQPYAHLLRVDWRLGSGPGPAAAEALALIDLDPFGGAEQLARRALAGVQSGQPGVAIQSLERLVSELQPKRSPLTPIAAEWALAALDETDATALTQAVRTLRPRLLHMRDRKPLSAAD